VKVDGVHEKFIYHPQQPHVLLPNSSPPIHGLEKGKMRRGLARPHEKSPSITNQKVAEGHDTDKKPSAAENFSMKFSRRVKNATPAATSSPVTPTT
jgi:hypothetical protein